MTLPESDQSRSIYVPGPAAQQFGHPTTWPAGQPPVPAAPIQAGPPAAPYRASTKSRIIVWSIAIVLLGSLAGLIGYSAYGAYNAPASVDQMDRKLIAACHAGVEARLKAPSTARYSSESITRTTETRWTATGAVDAHNSFGAMIRQQYTCNADRIGDNWKVAGVYFSD